mgnify:FL=1|tara:strand:- start:524 stop:664 length:141 start_codon:yes stop_codon:yes gene_type:complete
MKLFILGYITALLTLLIASCSISPLDANSSNCGESSWNPCYVKIVE